MGKVKNAMLFLVDNYDSFTYNLVHYLGELGAQTRVIRNDEMAPAEVFAASPRAIVISPGPCDPDRAGICLDLIRQAPADLPILGVCLGHQSIGQAFGGRIERCTEIMHGKLSPVQHENSDIFAGLPQNFEVTRYHSLHVAPDSIPECLRVTARTKNGVIMGLAHRQQPVYGVQFHPESIASQHGRALLKNFLQIAEAA